MTGSRPGNDHASRSRAVLVAALSLGMLGGLPAASAPPPPQCEKFKIKVKPSQGVKMTCEPDHIVSLQLGGADTLDNLWPQCGPNGVPLPKRHFKLKDDVENFIARQIKAGAMDMRDAQRRIAEDAVPRGRAAREAGAEKEMIAIARLTAQGS
jgi:hypothetical protein